MRFLWRNGQWVSAEGARPLLGPKLHLITDTVEPFKSMADGKHYDSKSRYRAEVKARGFEIVGNEKAQPRRFEPDKRAIEQVVNSVMRGEGG